MDARGIDHRHVESQSQKSSETVSAQATLRVLRSIALSDMALRPKQDWSDEIANYAASALIS